MLLYNRCSSLFFIFPDILFAVLFSIRDTCVMIMNNDKDNDGNSVIIIVVTTITIKVMTMIYVCVT